MISFWKEKKVLVTGSEGFVGSNLVTKLVKNGAKLKTLDVKSQRTRNNRVSHIKGDLLDYKSLEELFHSEKFDLVFHLGARTQVQDSFDDPFNTFETNIRGTYNLLEACRLSTNKVKAIIVASSDKAYGSHEHLPYFETSSLNPLFPYDVSKASADLIARTYRVAYEMPISVTRSANIYGGGDLNFNRLIPYCILQVINNHPIKIRSSGSSTRDYLFIEDAIEAYISLAEKMLKNQVRHDVFNFSSFDNLSAKSVVEIILKKMKKSAYPIEILNNGKCEIDHQSLSFSKAEKLLKWKPYVNFSVGIDLTIDWYLDFFKNNKEKMSELFSDRC